MRAYAREGENCRHACTDMQPYVGTDTHPNVGTDMQPNVGTDMQPNVGTLVLNDAVMLDILNINKAMI